MIEVHERVLIGTDLECRSGDSVWAVVHACKNPCHQRAVGYHGSLQKDHPNYLILERNNDLYLNMIDPPQPLFMLPLFTSFMSFASRHWDDGHYLLIHCNQGESRAPSLAMLLLAKHIGIISASSFDDAKRDFVVICPTYTPGLGIQSYLRQHWSEI
jgi:hypothetical protein